MCKQSGVTMNETIKWCIETKERENERMEKNQQGAEKLNAHTVQQQQQQTSIRPTSILTV